MAKTTMKGLKTQIDLAYEGKPQRKTKWTCQWNHKLDLVLVYHYQHLVLVHDLRTGKSKKGVQDTRADIRAADYAEIFIKEKVNGTNSNNES